MPFGENVGGNLASVGIHGEVELAPLPPGAAVLLRVPLSLAEQLQAGAVEHQVHGAVVAGNPRLATGEGPTRPGERSVIGNGQLEAEQAQHAAAERLGLAQGQHQLDRKIGVAGLPARCRPARCLPAGKRRRQPQHTA